MGSPDGKIGAFGIMLAGPGESCLDLRAEQGNYGERIYARGARGDVILPGGFPIDGGEEVKLLEVMDEDGERPDDLGIEPNGGLRWVRGV